MNFGIDYAIWDVAHSPEELDKVARQISALNTADSTVMFAKCNPMKLPEVQTFMEQASFKDSHPFFW